MGTKVILSYGFKLESLTICHIWFVMKVLRKYCGCNTSPNNNNNDLPLNLSFEYENALFIFKNRQNYIIGSWSLSTKCYRLSNLKWVLLVFKFKKWAHKASLLITVSHNAYVRLWHDKF